MENPKTETTLNAVRVSLIALLVLAVILGGYLYWRKQTYYPSTNDAYVQANVVFIASQVTGSIQEVNIADHQFVKKDQMLFKIDPKPFIIAEHKAQAELKNIQQNVAAQQAAISAASSGVNEAQARLDETQKNYNRIMDLVRMKVSSPQAGDNAEMQLRVAKASLQTTQQKLIQAQQQLGPTDHQNAAIQIAEHNLKNARLNLKYTEITAPADGFIVNMSLTKGDVVNATVPQFVLVQSNEWWVNANYKETQLERIKIGQSANIRLDLYPHHVFHGKVVGISHGSGASFSLLPAENATGNWVKVTQRFQVKIVIDNSDSENFPLRVGASCIVSVDTLAKG